MPQLLKLRRSIEWLSSTPLHPQWLVRQQDRGLGQLIRRNAIGTVIDIGCGYRTHEANIPTNSSYIGLDLYSTSTDWYETRPDVYADAALLPVKSGSVDCVLLTDVLEHLEEPQACLDEAARIMSSTGRLIFQVPFLYPIHDAPRDFGRWTEHGLRRLAEKASLQVSELEAVGRPFETAANLSIIAGLTALLKWMQVRNPLALLIVVAPVFVLTLNLGAWLLARLLPSEALMPTAYRGVMQQPDS